MFQFVTHGVAIQEPHSVVNLGMAWLNGSNRPLEKRKGERCAVSPFSPPNPLGSRLMGSRLICRRAGAVSYWRETERKMRDARFNRVRLSGSFSGRGCKRRMRWKGMMPLHKRPSPAPGILKALAFIGRPV